MKLWGYKRNFLFQFEIHVSHHVPNVVEIVLSMYSYKMVMRGV